MKVFCPKFINCYCQSEYIFSAFLELGGRGLDTALTYGVPTQTSVGEAVRASGLKREEIFVTTKIPCCPQAMVGSMCDAPYNGSVAEDVKGEKTFFYVVPHSMCLYISLLVRAPVSLVILSLCFFMIFVFAASKFHS